MDCNFKLKDVKELVKTLDDRGLLVLKQVRQNQLYNLKPNNNSYVICIEVIAAIQKEQRRRKLLKIYGKTSNKS